MSSVAPYPKFAHFTTRVHSRRLPYYISTASFGRAEHGAYLAALAEIAAFAGKVRQQRGEERGSVTPHQRGE